MIVNFFMSAIIMVTDLNKKRCISFFVLSSVCVLSPHIFIYMYINKLTHPNNFEGRDYSINFINRTCISVYSCIKQKVTFNLHWKAINIPQNIFLNWKMYQTFNTTLDMDFDVICCWWRIHCTIQGNLLGLRGTMYS